MARPAIDVAVQRRLDAREDTEWARRDAEARAERAAAVAAMQRRTEAEERIAADLSFDPECGLHDDDGHVCLRRDGRSVGVLGEAGDCFAGARVALYGDVWTESDDAAALADRGYFA